MILLGSGTSCAFVIRNQDLSGHSFSFNLLLLNLLVLLLSQLLDLLLILGRIIEEWYGRRHQ